MIVQFTSWLYGHDITSILCECRCVGRSKWLNWYETCSFRSFFHGDNYGSGQDCTMLKLDFARLITHARSMISHISQLEPPKRAGGMMKSSEKLMNPRLVSLRNHWRFIFRFDLFSLFFWLTSRSSRGLRCLNRLSSTAIAFPSPWLIRLEGGERREFFDISIISFSAAFIFRGSGVLEMGKQLCVRKTFAGTDLDGLRQRRM